MMFSLQNAKQSCICKSCMSALKLKLVNLPSIVSLFKIDPNDRAEVDTIKRLIILFFALVFIITILGGCLSQGYQSRTSVNLSTTSIASTSSQAATSGINGAVLIGPVSPVQKQGDANEKPYPDAVIFVMDASGQQKISEVKSDFNGLFTVYLAPGKYILSPQTPKGRPLPVGEPQEVVVLENHLTEVTVNYDSRIR
jgi:hypothetical protein